MSGLSVLLEIPKACPDRTLIICRTYAPKRLSLSPNGGGGGSNFLNDCSLCSEKLQFRKDIYMYRDRAFCSVECRYRQMLVDEDVRRRALAANRRRRRAAARERAIAGCIFAY